MEDEDDVIDLMEEEEPVATGQLFGICVFASRQHKAWQLMCCTAVRAVMAVQAQQPMLLYYHPDAATMLKRSYLQGRCYSTYWGTVLQ